MDNGWIKLHRCLLNNVLNQEHRAATKREAFEDILLLVAHTRCEVLLGERKVILKPGESVRSLDSWARQFNWSRSKVRRFFKLLEKENMIKTQSIGNSTHLTVCNYRIYQADRQTNDQHAANNWQANGKEVATDKNEKNEKNEKNGKNEGGGKTSLPFSLTAKKEKFWQKVQEVGQEVEAPAESLDAFYRYWSEHNEQGTKLKCEKQKTFNTKQRLEAWLKKEKKFEKPRGIELHADEYLQQTPEQRAKNFTHPVKMIGGDGKTYVCYKAGQAPKLENQ